MLDSAMAKHDFRSGCSIARTLEIVGDKWTLLVVRDLMWHGKQTFHALEESAEGVPTQHPVRTPQAVGEMGSGAARGLPETSRPLCLSTDGRGPVAGAGAAADHDLGDEHLGGGRYDPDTRKSVKAAS